MIPRQIALLTDFGFTDPFVGIMKGVISRISPGLDLIDLTHLVPPGDIQRGAFYLWQAASHFPSNAVFLAVVDPGVGSNRKGLFFQRGDQIFIGPDNGLFSYLHYQGKTKAWELANPDYQLQNISSTFHGRDIFAPAAAFAAQGIPGKAFGKVVDDLVELPQPRISIEQDRIRGEVLGSDHFGNLITSLGKFHVLDEQIELRSWIDDQRIQKPRGAAVYLDKTGTTLPLVATFQDIPTGACAGLIGSTGLLEIAANQDSAARLLELDRGDTITFIWK